MLIRQLHINDLVTYQSPLLTELGAPHGFSTRLGGCSQGPFQSLNTASTSPSPDLQADTDANVETNLHQLERALELSDRERATACQVHGSRAVMATKNQPAPACDGLVTGDPSRALLIRTADCVPILLADRSHRGVAAVHAGWRGLQAGVIQETIRLLNESLGIKPDDLVAAIGPAISVKHFQVGEEVVEALRAAIGNRLVVRHDISDRPHVDLPASTHRQLVHCGLASTSIDTTDRCTFEHEAEFFSHRRDRGRTGRLAAMIALPHVLDHARAK